MRARQIITVGAMILGNSDFDLGDDAKNRDFAQKLLRRKKETLEATDDFDLFLTGNGINGYIALYLKKEALIGYVIKYMAEKRALLGGTVTQIMLWRRPATPFVPGITRHVFFDHLLKRWPMVMSDAVQTQDGADFWRDRLAEASTGPYRVGLVDFGRGTIDWWDKADTFNDWLRSHNAWGDHRRFENQRYVIGRV